MTYSDSATAASVSAASIFILCFICLLLIVLIAGTIFWIFMLIDAIKREWKDRQTWIIVLVVSFIFGLHFITAVVYYFVVKKPNIGKLNP